MRTYPLLAENEILDLALFNMAIDGPRLGGLHPWCDDVTPVRERTRCAVRAS